MQTFTRTAQEELHRKALTIAGEYLRFEAQLIGMLQELDRAKTYLHFEQPSLFAYATKCLKLSESVALTLIGIARKSMQVPELETAIEEKKINISNARRIVPILTPENKAHWIEKATRLTQSKLDQELAVAFPEKAAPPKIKFKSESLARLEVDLSKAALELLKRAQEILSQETRQHVDVAGALETIVQEFVERRDPLKKAERARDRKKRTAIGVTRERPQKNMEKLHVLRRVQLNAQRKHEIVLRDAGQCTFLHSDGSRCPAKQWLDVHHLRPVGLGGGNAVENLRTLCAAHHRMAHGALGKADGDQREGALKHLSDERPGGCSSDNATLTNARPFDAPQSKKSCARAGTGSRGPNRDRHRDRNRIHVHRTRSPSFSALRFPRRSRRAVDQYDPLHIELTADLVGPLEILVSARLIALVDERADFVVSERADLT